MTDVNLAALRFKVEQTARKMRTIDIESEMGAEKPHLHKLAFEVAVELELYAEEMAAIADFLAEKH